MSRLIIKKYNVKNCLDYETGSCVLYEELPCRETLLVNVEINQTPSNLTNGTNSSNQANTALSNPSNPSNPSNLFNPSNPSNQTNTALPNPIGTPVQSQLAEQTIKSDLNEKKSNIYDSLNKTPEDPARDHGEAEVEGRIEGMV